MGEDKFIIRFCEVLEVDDNQDGLRIKVRFQMEDYDIKDDKDLPYCYPLLPKLLHVHPKVHEMVFVILQRQENALGNRFFIGPVIDQPYNTYDCNFFQAQTLFQGKQLLSVEQESKRDPNNEGTLPNREDIAIQGRKNTDIILKDDEMQFRCGFKKNPLATAKTNLHFNTTDLAYIQMKYGNFKDEKNRDFKSVINIVADRINLLSHDSMTSFKLGEKRGKLVDNALLGEILSTSHPLPYGDKIVAFLKMFMQAFLTHEHKWAQTSPTITPIIQQCQTSLLDSSTKFLSQSIHIN